MACRPVTAEECDHYRECGWVRLKGFVDPDVISSLLAVAREQMGDDADSYEKTGRDSNSSIAEKASEPGATRLATKARRPYFNAEYSAGLTNPVIRPVIGGAARSAKLLMGRRPEVGVRYYTDVFIPKLPLGKPTKHGGNAPTSFHQDFMTHCVDRSGGMTFWIPLEAYGPDSGTVSFVSGSHRLGVMGDHTSYQGDEILDTYPRLRDLPLSGPMSYEAGDIHVHSHLTVHGSGANLTDRPRWAYILLTQPADACWNGAPSPNFDSADLEPWQQLGDDRFPLIA